jgi:hypothetical protein
MKHDKYKNRVRLNFSLGPSRCQAFLRTPLQNFPMAFTIELKRGSERVAKKEQRDTLPEMPGTVSHARILSMADNARHLDTVQLQRL